MTTSPNQPRRTALPTAPTSFIGRRREQVHLSDLLQTSRLITVTGAAGCGKTRLALEVARAAAASCPHGAHWLALAPISDPALLPQALTTALWQPHQTDRPSFDQLLARLRHTELLLVFDNCEHLLQPCAELVRTLLAETPLTILATSREPLQLPGEQRYPLPPLSLPPATQSGDDPSQLLQYDALNLFTTRARAVLPAFTLTKQNAPRVVHICRNLDGIPLALELASARVDLLTLDEIAARLDNHFELLFPANHVTYTHHETLRAAVDWSHALLSIPEQIMLRRLSIFAGGCSITAARTVCSGVGIKPHHTLNLLASLVRKSLLLADTLGRDEAHYALPETIRQYAREKLDAAGELPTTGDRHLHCYLQLVEEAAPKLNGPYQQLWLQWLENQNENLRAALTWALQRDPSVSPTPIEAGLRLAVVLYQFWTIRNYRQEGLRWYQRLLARAPAAVSPLVRANALAYASLMSAFAGDSQGQQRYAAEAVSYAESAGAGGHEVLATALGAQAFAAQKSGDFQTALTLGLRQIALQRQFDDPLALGLSLSYYSFMAMSLEKYDAARDMLDEGIPILRRVANPYRLAMALNYQGDLHRCLQDHASAVAAYDESIALLRQIAASRDLASVYHNQGHAYLRLGDISRAQTLFLESMEIHRQHENTMGMAESLLGFAALALHARLPATAARLLATAESVGGRQITADWAATRLTYHDLLAETHAALTASAFAREQAAAHNLSLQQAVALAVETAAKLATQQTNAATVDDLTPRERQIVTLIAHARTNGEIARELVISKRTVEKHIANIRAKLAFDRRAQIVRWAIDSGLAPDGTADASHHSA